MITLGPYIVKLQFNLKLEVYMQLVVNYNEDEKTNKKQF